MSTAGSEHPEAPRRRRSLRGEVGTTGARFGSPALRRHLEEEQPAEVPKPPRKRRSLRGEVGATGARFGSAALRRSLEAEDPPQPPAPREESDPEETAPFSGHFDEVETEVRAEPEPEPALEWSGPLVRPYAWTRGRTSSQHDLRIETLVSLEEHGIAIAMRDTTPEQRAIVELCASTRSVAEVSALLSLPLGVVRVLLGDLIDMGVVAAHHNAAAGPDLMLMERVLQGLRNL
ncbi:DUF742 domain-containing protein [Saccharothrix variisporea]|uniref:Uncharacterized protein DUF742 n=1 Tax=Saccharothrix variisporea TaxID=543527 RepID=A0A495X5T4_9PSEU|nr:DUF742 domain-containing protein [Saccharothrix variisporea]RKT68889.1 uncharacterized protein DUF742 [Saccharothrix variisporea]